MSKPSWTTQMEPYRDVRQGILNRKPRQESNVCKESIQAQYNKEMDALKGRRSAFEESEAQRLKLIHGDRSDKKEIAEQLHKDLQALIVERDRARHQFDAEERKIELEMLERIKYADLLEKDQDAAHAEYERYVYEQNQKLVAQRSELSKEQQALEMAEDADRPNFFATHFQKSTR